MTMERKDCDRMLDEFVGNDLDKTAEKFGVSRKLVQDAFDCILLCRSMSEHVKESFEEKKRQEKLDYDTEEKAIELLNAIHLIVMTREVYIKARGDARRIMEPLLKELEPLLRQLDESCLKEMESECYSETAKELADATMGEHPKKDM